MAGIKVKLIRSRAGRSESQLATLLGLGLYKFGQERVLPDTPETMGMCRKLVHMVSWERVEQDPIKKARRALKAKSEQVAR